LERPRAPNSYDGGCYNTKAPDNIKSYSNEGMVTELANWREELSITKAKQLCRSSTEQKYSVAVLACGGLLDTLAAIRAGLMPIWGSDTDQLSREMWNNLVGNQCYDDAFKINYSALRRPTVLKTGFPCPDYTTIGSNKGMKGRNGWQYVKQSGIIKQISPDVAVTEHPEEVKLLTDDLSTDYIIHQIKIPVWIHGDPSNRNRFIIIAWHKRLGDAAHEYQFPAATFNTQHYHTAADIAVPDDQVPPEYILHGEPTEIYKWTEPTPGKIHHLGNYGEGIGHCHNPHPLHSWWGLANTQLTSNGGARRVMLNWRPGQPVYKTRLTVPIETIRMASLSHTYLDWARSFDNNDQFMRRCVNNGVPMRTSTAIDQSIIQTLIQAGVHPDVPASRPQHTASEANIWDVNTHRNWYIRSMLVDTGATGSLNYTDIESLLQHATDSRYRIAVAKGDTFMEGSKDGKLNIMVLNTAAQKGFQSHTPFSINTTTVGELRTELLSLDGPYRHGKWNILLRQPDFESGVNELYRAAQDGLPEARIPLRYDYTGKGGWWLDYMIHDEVSPAHQVLLTRHHQDMCRDNSEASEAELMRASYSQAAGSELWQQIGEHSAVKSIILANETTIWARHPDERQVKGVKQGLKHGKQKIPYKEFHRKHAHIGNCDDTCDVCRMIKGAMRRITLKVDPHRETRVGHTWSMDGITWSNRSLNGSKYTVVLRDRASGVIKLLHLYLRSDIVTQLEQWILQTRADPAYSDLPYKVVNTIITDEPGEWSRRSKAWQAMLLRVTAVEAIYVTPETSKEAGHAEKNNSVVEEATKAILMEQNLPPDHWEAAANNAEWLLNRFPNIATTTTAPINGDQARPLELITRGRYSRRQIDRELSYFVQIGTPALVHTPKVRGSTIAPKVRWGIAWGMYRDQVIWLCPYTRSTFRSKSFAAFELRHNMNYAQFLGLPQTSTARKALAIPSDATETVDVHLTPAREPAQRGLPPVIQLQCVDETGVQHINLPQQQATAQTEHREDSMDGTHHEFRGSVRVIDSEQQLITGPHTIELQEQGNSPLMLHPNRSGPIAGEQERNQQPGEHNHTRQNRQNSTAPGEERDIPLIHDTVGLGDLQQNSDHDQQLQSGVGDQTQNRPTEQYNCEFDSNYEFDDSDNEEEEEAVQRQLDSIAEILSERDAINIGINVTYGKLCKEYSIPFELQDLYYEWLLNLRQGKSYRFNQDTIPRGRGKHIKTGLKIPAPCGSDWRSRIKAHGIKRGNCSKMNITQNKNEINQALHSVHESLKACDALATHWEEQQEIEAHATRKTKKARKKAPEEGPQPPRSIPKAIRDENREEAFKWLESINQEWDGLTKLGVLDHNYTRKQLQHMGVYTNPIPFSVCLTYKYDEDGNINRYKTRLALAGHKGNMQQGVHFDRTYSSTPIMHSTKILQALMVRYKLHRLAFDIKQAYCQADLPADQMIAVRYPEGFRRYSEAGEELYMILRKNLYGHPAAGRTWEKRRNKVIMELFNNDEWTCKRCVKEPCMFLVTHSSGAKTWMLVWTDDVDMVGEDESILQKIYSRVNDVWESKLVDPSFMLGIKRTINHTAEGDMEVELTMTAFVEQMVDAFETHLLNKTVSTPLPPGFFVSKAQKSSEEENQRVLDKGYQRLFGSLLWAARGTFPECLQGTSMLGRVMAAPTEEAWAAACHMLTYMHQHKHSGIKYSSAGNQLPVAFVDSSNKADPADSKCQYGYAHLWMGGAIITCSKKLAHVGLSSAHNEYMAAHWANRHTAWLRDLLEEMGIKEVGATPTVTYGDNRAANLLCEEDIITCGNQFMQVPYHYNKEAVKAGVVEMRYISTTDNLADIFTKAVPRQVLERLLPSILGHRVPVTQSMQPASDQPPGVQAVQL
jgi:site-specific DNA-cytosine methylase